MDPFSSIDVCSTVLSISDSFIQKLPQSFYCFNLLNDQRLRPYRNLRVPSRNFGFIHREAFEKLIKKNPYFLFKKFKINFAHTLKRCTRKMHLNGTMRIIDFPTPFSPTMETLSPGLRSKFRSCKISLIPKEKLK